MGNLDLAVETFRKKIMLDSDVFIKRLSELKIKDYELYPVNAIMRIEIKPSEFGLDHIKNLTNIEVLPKNLANILQNGGYMDFQMNLGDWIMGAIKELEKENA